MGMQGSLNRCQRLRQSQTKVLQSRLGGVGAGGVGGFQACGFPNELGGPEYTWYKATRSHNRGFHRIFFLERVKTWYF